MHSQTTSITILPSKIHMYLLLSLPILSSAIIIKELLKKYWLYIYSLLQGIPSLSLPFHNNNKKNNSKNETQHLKGQARRFTGNYRAAVEGQPSQEGRGKRAGGGGRTARCPCAIKQKRLEPRTDSGSLLTAAQKRIIIIKASSEKKQVNQGKVKDNWPPDTLR